MPKVKASASPPKTTFAPAKVGKKPKTSALQGGGCEVKKVDAGPLLNIASTDDIEVALRAARRAGIITAAGKLSRKYR